MAKLFSGLGDFMKSKAQKGLGLGKNVFADLKKGVEEVATFIYDERRFGKTTVEVIGELGRRAAEDIGIIKSENKKQMEKQQKSNNGMDER